MGISERLKKLRSESGHTQEEIAEKLKIKRSTYQSWERGLRNPKKSSLEKLAAVFGVPVSYLLGETDIKDLDALQPHHRKKILLCERIKELRQKAGYTQKKLAETLNIEQPRIVEWEKGKISPNSRSLERLASVFNVSVSYLLGETDIKDLNQVEEDTTQVNNIIPLVRRLFPVEVECDIALSAGLGEGYTDCTNKKTVYWDREVSYDKAVPIKGDSMTPDYESGEIALIREGDTLDYEGHVCAVDDIERGKSYIKCVYFEEDCLVLVSLNDAVDEFGELLYPDIRIPFEDNPRIVGRVFEHFFPIEEIQK